MNSRKVSNGTPNLTERSVRTEHGMTYKPRGSWSQSLHSSRRSHDLPGRLGKPAVGRRKTGDAESQLKRGMRNARCQGLLGTRSRTWQKGIATRARVSTTL